MKSKRIFRKLKDGTFLFFARNKLIKIFNKKIHKVAHDNNSMRFLEKRYGKYLASLPTLSESTEKKEKIIWWCWLQGEDNAPDLCKGCLNSLRHQYPDYKINIITLDNVYDYIDFPDFIKEKYKKGIIPHAHFSDLIRLELLIKYGGTWIDSSVYSTGRCDYIEQYDFFVYKTFLNNNDCMSASNWFISSNKDNPILITTRDLLLEYWRTKDSLINYFVFHLFFTMATRKYSELWKKVINIPNQIPHILQFELTNKYSQKRMDEIKHLSTFHKLTQKLVVDNIDIKDTYYEKVIKGELL